MKSVRKAFKRRIQSRYNLRSRKPLTTTVRTSTPKVSSYVQVDLSEEEGCELFQELPFCVVPPHASEENYSESHTQEPRRISTAYSSQYLADCTNREPIDISIDSREEPSIVRPSSSRPEKHSESRENSLNPDIQPVDSSRSQTDPHIALEVEGISKSDSENEETNRRKKSSTTGEHFPIINSPADLYTLVRSRINYTKSKQSESGAREEYCDSSDSDDESSEEETEASGEFYANDENSKDSSTKATDPKVEQSGTTAHNETSTGHITQMNSEEMTDLQRQVMDLQQQMCRQLKETQAVMEGVTVSEPVLVKPTLFHGYESENVDRWLQRFTLYLTNRKIKPGSDQAAIQLALHLQGPAESFYYNLPVDVQSSFTSLRNALKERFSPAHRSLRLRQELSVRRQGSSESIEKYLADLNDKFSCLDLRDEDKLSYLIQGLRPDIQAEVLKKEPKTYAAAEDTARLIYSIQQSLSQRREDDISRIVLQERMSRTPSGTSSSTQKSTASEQSVLAAIEQLLQKTAVQKEESIMTKLDALLAGDITKKSEVQSDQTLLAKLSELLDKMSSQSANYCQKQNEAHLAAYSEPNRRETPDYMKEIRKIKDSLMDMIQTLDRRVDARINGLARRNQPSREEPPRQRTPEGRPICYNCGRVGHVQQNCTERPSRESPSNSDRFQPNMPRRPYSENYLPRSSYSPQQRRNDLPSRDSRDPRMAALNQEPFADLIALVARNDETNPTASYNAQNADTVISTPQCAEDTQEHINRPGRKLDARINGIARSIRPRQEANEKYRDHRLRAKPVCYRCGRPGHIQYYCNRNYQSEDHCYNQEERQFYRTTEPTFRQPVRTYTLEEENPLDPGRASSLEQLKTSHQENATSTPTLHQKTTPTLTRDQTQIKIRKPNQHPRKTRMSNQMRNVLLPLDTEAYMNPRGLTTNGKIAGKSVHLLVDTGACVSAIDEQFLKKTYGEISLNMSDGPFSSVKTVSGEEVPLLGKLTVPLHLNGRQYPCEFHVMQNLAYDAILGLDFLQENRALIDLDNSTITIKDSATQRNQASSTIVPLMGTFIPQGEDLKAEENDFVNDAHMKPSSGNLVRRYSKNKELGLTQSLLTLVLIVLYLFATAHTDINDKVNSAIQKPQSSSAQVFQEGECPKRYVTDTPAEPDFQMELDKRIEPNQEEPPGTEVLRFHDLPQKTSNHLQPLPTFGPSRELTY